MKANMVFNYMTLIMDDFEKTTLKEQKLFNCFQGLRIEDLKYFPIKTLTPNTQTFETVSNIPRTLFKRLTRAATSFTV